MPAGPQEERARLSADALARGGLPTAATERLDQLTRSESWTSDLSVNAFAAVRDVGFDPVGQVMGSTVDYLGYGGWGDCGFGVPTQRRRYRRPLTSNVVGVAGGLTEAQGYQPLVRALYAARRRATMRLQQEADALGGDGVVGVRLTIAKFPSAAHALEFQATGTAVRARGDVGPPRPFLSDLSGQDFAKLIRSGWAPCGLVYGVGIGVRHDDYETRRRSRFWRNAELPAHTELLQHTRAEARRTLAWDVAVHGGEGAVLQVQGSRVWSRECRNVNGVKDHCAEITYIGTAITRFRSDAVRPAAPLRVMRLDGRLDAVLSDRLTAKEREFK